MMSNTMIIVHQDILQGYRLLRPCLHTSLYCEKKEMEIVKNTYDEILSCINVHIFIYIVYIYVRHNNNWLKTLKQELWRRRMSRRG